MTFDRGMASSGDFAEKEDTIIIIIVSPNNMICKPEKIYLKSPFSVRCFVHFRKLIDEIFIIKYSISV